MVVVDELPGAVAPGGEVAAAVLVREVAEECILGSGIGKAARTGIRETVRALVGGTGKERGEVPAVQGVRFRQGGSGGPAMVG